MDPPLNLMNHSTFSPCNPSSYSFSKIWPPNFPLFSHSPSRNLPDPSAEESTLTHHCASPNRRKRKDHVNVTATSEDNSSKNDSSNKQIKLGGSKDENGGLNAEAEASSATFNKSAEQSVKPSEPPKQDYIHVRARRGQATDSHSLAERARREKISKRMKILQDLVPGCNNVIGKTLVLDGIISYIQSLQLQVEFLSMKLEVVNSRLNMNPPIECFPAKDVGNQPFDLSGMIFGPQANRGYAQGSQPGWLHMQRSGGF